MQASDVQVKVRRTWRANRTSQQALVEARSHRPAAVAADALRMTQGLTFECIQMSLLHGIFHVKICCTCDLQEVGQALGVNTRHLTRSGAVAAMELGVT